MAGFGVKQTGYEKVIERFSLFASRSADLSKPLIEFGFYLKSRAIERIDARQVDTSVGPRIVTGTMGKSINTQIRGPREAVTGTNTKYAALQQLGGIQLPTAGKKALALPIDKKYRRKPGLWPSELPRESLQFIPSPTGGKSGRCIGVLVDPKSLERHSKSAAKASKKMTASKRALRGELRKLSKGGKYLTAGERHRRGVIVRRIHARETAAATAGIKPLKILFALMTSVTIPGRPYLILDAAASDYAADRVAKHIMG